ncbi:hypothetical protein BAE44_0012232, partial [Dichanthelium oligosanthes]
LLEAGSTTGAATVNSTSLDEDKIYVIFCVAGKCNDFGHGWQNCYCCGDMNSNVKTDCHETMEECRANCPHCDPKCPPQSSSSVRAATNITL